MLERKKDGDVQIIASKSIQCRYATSNTAEPCSSVFSYFHFTFLLQHQYLNSWSTKEVKSKNKFIPSGQDKNVFKLSPPQRSQTTSKSQLQKCLTNATVLWINIKNRPQELDLKKINPAAPNFLSLLDVVLNFDMKCIFLNWNLSLNYLWTMNSFKKNNYFLITRINAVVLLSEFP